MAKRDLNVRTYLASRMSGAAHQISGSAPWVWARGSEHCHDACEPAQKPHARTLSTQANPTCARRTSDPTPKKPRSGSRFSPRIESARPSLLLWRTACPAYTKVHQRCHKLYVTSRSARCDHDLRSCVRTVSVSGRVLQNRGWTDC
jgi:hypothetical protein